jgi:hypothetical protein
MDILHSDTPFRASLVGTDLKKLGIKKSVWIAKAHKNLWKGFI